MRGKLVTDVFSKIFITLHCVICNFKDFTKTSTKTIPYSEIKLLNRIELVEVFGKSEVGPCPSISVVTAINLPCYYLFRRPTRP